MEENVNIEMRGAFMESLVRNNKKIRQDRAQSIGEDTQILYKRRVEDLRIEIQRMKREQENMLDLSPTSADSLVLASDFDAAQYVEKDNELGRKIRDKGIMLEIAEARYKYLFGEEI